MQQQRGSQQSTDETRPPNQEPSAQIDPEFEALVKAAEEFDAEDFVTPPEPPPEPVRPTCGVIHLPVVVTGLEPIGVSFRRTFNQHHPVGMRVVWQETNGDITEPMNMNASEAVGATPEELGQGFARDQPPKSTGFHVDDNGRLLARLMIGDPQEPGCHALVARVINTVNYEMAMEQIMDLWEGVRTFPGIRQFDNVTVLEHLEALKDMYPYLQCTTVRKTPVAKCQAQLRARRGCQEWTLKRGTLCAECLKSLFLP